MHHIVTITFSPSIDKSTTVSSLLPEKKLKCTTPRLNPGGGGINVARAIKKLGGEATAIFPSGGYTGNFFNQLMEEESVPSLIIKSSQETRENIEVLDESTGNQYRFGFPGTELSEKEWKECIAAVQGMENVEFIVASGSLPPGVPLDVYGQFAKIAKKQNAKYIVDTSGDALRHALEEGVYLIKPNLGELSALLGVSRIEPGHVESLAKKIINTYRCEVVVVSYGKDGAMLVTKNETHQVKSPKVAQKSTVGAGDSMVAGIVLSISKGMNLKQALQYGVACGTAATMNQGTELCNKKDADHLFKLISS